MDPQRKEYDYSVSSENPSLGVFFSPRSIALVGATERPHSVGYALTQNMRDFSGSFYPIHLTRKSVCGIPACPSVLSIPGEIDLAIVAVPAPSVPVVVGECAEKGVKGCIIISSGFREAGQEGLEREQRLMKQRGNMKIVGPNCLGIMVLASERPYNASFAPDIAPLGSVALLTQSGALMTSLVDWGRSKNVGFSSCISLGSMVDVDWGECIGYLAQDEKTHLIALYMEDIQNPKKFLNAVRCCPKPVVVLKGGNTPEAMQAVASHTGAMVQDDSMWVSAFEQVGIYVSRSIEEWFDMMLILSNLHSSKKVVKNNQRLVILTNAGGLGVLTTDMLVQSKGTLAKLSPHSIDALNKELPPHWSRSNPVDVLGDAPARHYQWVLEHLREAEEVDAVLVILTPQNMTEPLSTARAVLETFKRSCKPILASWVGGDRVKEAQSYFHSHHIPHIPDPERMVKRFTSLVHYLSDLEENKQRVKGQSSLVHHHSDIHARLSRFIDSGRKFLTEDESKDILKDYGVLTEKSVFIRNKEEIDSLMQDETSPFVMKMVSSTVTHKSDVGGVITNLRTKKEVKFQYDQLVQTLHQRGIPFEGVTLQRMLPLKEGFECIIGGVRDPKWGVIMLFGAGGTWTEWIADRAMALAPIDQRIAGRMIRETRIGKCLFEGMREKKRVNLNVIESALQSVSQLMMEQEHIAECEINPFFVSSSESAPLDARIVLKS